MKNRMGLVSDHGGPSQAMPASRRRAARDFVIAPALRRRHCRHVGRRRHVGVAPPLAAIAQPTLRERRMPRARNRDVNVVGDTPSNSAAPPTPDLPAAALDRGNEAGALAGAAPASVSIASLGRGLASPPPGLRRPPATPRRSQADRRGRGSLRSITLASSRTLPGHRTARGGGRPRR